VTEHGFREATREQYTWETAARDLALMTPMRLLDAARIVGSLEGLLHPYDALPPLLVIFDPDRVASVEAQGKALAALVRLGKQAD
jgi:hypothetical protein